MNIIDSFLGLATISRLNPPKLTLIKFNSLKLFITGIFIFSSFWELNCNNAEANLLRKIYGLSGSFSKKGNLTRAVIRGDRDLVARLIKGGADVNETLSVGEKIITPLIAAAALGRKEILDLLVTAGASNKPTYDGYTARDFLYYLHDEDSARLLSIQEAMTEMTGKKGNSNE